MRLPPPMQPGRPPPMPPQPNQDATPPEGIYTRLLRLSYAGEGRPGALKRLGAHVVQYVALGLALLAAMPLLVGVCMPLWMLYSLGEVVVLAYQENRDALVDAGVLRQKRPPRQGGDGGDDGVS